MTKFDTSLYNMIIVYVPFSLCGKISKPLLHKVLANNEYTYFSWEEGSEIIIYSKNSFEYLMIVADEVMKALQENE